MVAEKKAIFHKEITDIVVDPANIVGKGASATVYMFAHYVTTLHNTDAGQPTNT